MIIVVCATAASAQTIPTFYQPFGLVKDFLQLSDAQLQTILKNNNEYSSWASGKYARLSQVQSEIAQETSKENLDPMALGVRYTEVELICRDIKQQAPATQKKNTDLLTDQQKAKLKTLEDAMKLAPVIFDAQNAKLLAGSSSGFSYIFDPLGAYGLSGTLIGLPSLGGGCSPIPTSAIRTGDFTSAAEKGK